MLRFSRYKINLNNFEWKNKGTKSNFQFFFPNSTNYPSNRIEGVEKGSDEIYINIALESSERGSLEFVPRRAFSLHEPSSMAREAPRKLWKWADNHGCCVGASWTRSRGSRGFLPFFFSLPPPPLLARAFIAARFFCRSVNPTLSMDRPLTFNKSKRIGHGWCWPR